MAACGIDTAQTHARRVLAKVPSRGILARSALNFNKGPLGALVDGGVAAAAARKRMQLARR